ncbi:hypothetical protein EA472_00130 [Natrarchaeobius oligotrophus]|uniref:Uncharacterized protein n=1 Tax=Natrarchaeobius chitinivorans TaxID=1679083 RepID=A0A3N6N5D8_NATCH|nr:hypothetical protein EA472_00130 [Natrarchaeobius chitinivorans]
MGRRLSLETDENSASGVGSERRAPRDDGGDVGDERRYFGRERSRTTPGASDGRTTSDRGYAFLPLVPVASLHG